MNLNSTTQFSLKKNFKLCYSEVTGRVMKHTSVENVQILRKFHSEHIIYYKYIP